MMQALLAMTKIGRAAIKAAYGRKV